MRSPSESLLSSLFPCPCAHCLKGEPLALVPSVQRASPFVFLFTLLNPSSGTAFFPLCCSSQPSCPCSLWPALPQMPLLPLHPLKGLPLSLLPVPFYPHGLFLLFRSCKIAYSIPFSFFLLFQRMCKGKASQNKPVNKEEKGDGGKTKKDKVKTEETRGLVGDSVK